MVLDLRHQLYVEPSKLETQVSSSYMSHVINNSPAACAALPGPGPTWVRDLGFEVSKFEGSTILTLEIGSTWHNI